MSSGLFTALTPKAETQAAAFLAEHPAYDGRGVIVAILDTGVDPAAAGLAVCPDGSPKILDLVDASGSGDVDTRTVVRSAQTNSASSSPASSIPGALISALRGGNPTLAAVIEAQPSTPVEFADPVVTSITGLTGRTLRLNPAWVNPSGEWRVGIKPAADLYPKPLAQRRKKERTAAADKAIGQLLINAMREAATFNATHPSPAPGSPIADQAAELTKRVTLLQQASSMIEDVGPIYDVIAWNEAGQGEPASWRAAIDTRCDGDMTHAVGLTNFRKERQWGVLDAETLLSYALNIYDDGDVVSIVTDAGAHGTHVAGIVGAYHGPGNPLNGVAPGAQFIGVKIGDHRIGSMETGSGLLRGLRAVVDNGAHIINMSYGEPSSRPSYGRFMEMSTHIAKEKNVLFVSSAGNNGPALTTVGAPGGVHPYIIGVGAAVTQSMMTDQYALRKRYAAPQGGEMEALVEPDALSSAVKSHFGDTIIRGGQSVHDRAEDTNYTWSSRGPAMDGALGVSICAPGGAITSVPAWSLQKNQLMNGTSMSSPNAAGCIALMVSGLLHRHVPYNVQIIRRAIQNTAAAIVGATDTFGTGYGMIQVRSAFEHVLLQHAVRVAASITHGMHPEPFLEVTVPNGGAGSGEPTDRGIYRRDQSQSELAEDVNVTINPTWTEDVSNEAKFGYQLSLELVPTATGWISCPERVLVMNGGRSFLAHINPRDLLPGSVNFAEILAYEHLPEAVVRAVIGGDNADVVSGALALRRSLGPLLRIPATVIKPESPKFTSAGCEYIFTERESTQIPLIPGAVHRRFIAVPVGATWAEIRVHRTDSGSATPIDALMSATTPALSSIVGAHSRDVVDTSSRTVVVHAMQVVRHLSGKATSHEEYLYMRPHSRDALAIPVISNTTLEVVLAQFWNSLGYCEAAVEIHFFGVTVEPGVITADTSSAMSKITVIPALHDTIIKPIVKLTAVVSILEPVAMPQSPFGYACGAVVPLRSRDVLPNDKPQFGLTFAYKLTLDEKVSGATLSSERVHFSLYESSFDSQLLIVVDSFNNVVGTSDAFPEKLTLAAGEYTVYLQMRHDDPKKLEALLPGVQLQFKRPLAKKDHIAIKCTTSVADAIAGSGSTNKRARVGVRLPLFLSIPRASGLPKGIKVGDHVTGYALFEDYSLPSLTAGLPGATKSEEASGHTSGRDPRGVPVTVYVTSLAPPAPAKPAPKAEEPKDKFVTALKEATLKLLKESDPLQASTPAEVERVAALLPQLAPVATSSIAPASATNVFGAIASRLTEMFPQDITIAQAILASVDEAVVGPSASKLFSVSHASATTSDSFETQLARVVSAADFVINAIDTKELSAYFGLRHDETALQAPGASKTHAAMTEQKNALIDALWRKFRILSVATQLFIAGAAFNDVVVADTTFQELTSQLEQWVNPSDAGYTLLNLEKALRKNQLAVALDIVNTTLNMNKTDSGKVLPYKTLLTLRESLLERLGWTPLVSRATDKKVAAAFPFTAPCL